MPLTYDNSRIVGGLMPSLDLGFSDNDYRLGLKKVGFSDIVTFSRASGGGRFNASGQYEWLAAGEPRIDYDPVTGECRGILIEEQRTNLFTQSQDFSNAAWGKGKGAVVEEGIAAWSGKPQYRLTATEAGAFAGRIERAVGVSSASYSCGFFIKRGTANWACITVEMTAVGKGRRVWFDLVSGAVGPNTAAGVSPNQWAWRAGIQKVSGSEFFCWVSVDATESGALSSVVIAPDSNMTSNVSVGNSIFISGAQLEQGAFPTSYIPTATAQVTRAGDVCSVNNLSPWYRADEGTLIVEATVISSRTPPQVLIGIGDGTIKNRLQLRVANNNLAGLRIVSSGDQEVDAAVVSQNLVGTTSKLASSFSGGFQRSSVNGVLHGIAAPVSALPLVTVLQIGRGEGSSILQGYIRRIRYIPRRISDTDLQALTAL